MFDRPRLIQTKCGRLAAVSLLALECCSCQREDASSGTNQAAVSSAASGPSASNASAAKARGFPGAPRVEMKLTWEAPAPWVVVPLQARDVRRGAYSYPKQAGDAEDAELGVFYFGPSVGGDVDPNLKRWAGQFGKSVAEGKVTKKDAGAISLVLFEIDGTYQPGRSMAPKAPKPGYAMLGAIAQVKSSGNYFFKLTGPKATVEAARAAFTQLLDSLKEKSPD